MTKQKTITVAGHFGDKQLTLDEFVKRWDDHVAELNRLCWDSSWLEEVDEIRAKVEAKAKQEFNDTWERQNG